MSITINDAWKVNRDGTLRTEPSYNLTKLSANLSNLELDKRHGIYNNVPIEMWWAHYDWGETTPQSTIDYCRSVVSRANEFYDNSYCWAGLGYESFISRADYVCYGNIVTGQSDEPLEYRDSSTNTPWTFDYNTQERQSGQYPNGANWHYGSWQSNKATYGYQQCWKNNTNISNPNNNNQYWQNYGFCDWSPINILAPKNWVNLIVVIAKKSLSSLDYRSNVGAWDLYTYAKTNVHEEYPYILGVFIVPYMEYEGSLVPSGKRSALMTGDSANQFKLFRLTTYLQPAISGKLLYTSNDGQTKNYMHEYAWHPGIISRTPMIGSFINYNETSARPLRYLTDTNPSSNPQSTLCAIQIAGAINPESSTTALTQNGIFTYWNTLDISVELGNSKWKRELNTYTVSGTDYKGVCYYREFDDSFYEEAMRQAACFGLLFTDRYSVAYEGELYDPNMFLGILDEDSVGHGDYTRGYENLDEPQLNWTNTEDSTYDPAHRPPTPGPDPDPNPIGPSTPGFTLAYENGSVCYTINKSEWKRIWDDIYGGSTDWDNLISGLALYGSNPLNAILNYRWYPFELGGTRTNPIRLGSTIVQPSSHVYHYISSQSESFISSTASFNWGRPKNFINTRKSKARIFLPFYGYYELPMSMLVDKELEVQFQYNIPDDAAVWFIMFNGTIYDYVECMPYIEIPITGDNSLQIAAAKAQRNLSIATTVGAAVAGAVIGGAAGLAKGVIASGFGNAMDIAENGILETASLLWDNASYAELAMGFGGAALGAAAPLAGGGLKTANTMMQSALQIGTLSTNVPIHSAASDTTFLHLPFYPFIQIFQNIPQETFNESEYKKTVGIACDKWGTLSEMPENSLIKTTGVANMNTSGMELDEAKELNSILQTGFYR